MSEVWLRLTLLDDAVLTERSATVGGHRSLDHIPGSALLGAVAARAYASLDENAAFRIFHSGRVRYGSACPVGNDGGVTVPTPLSLYEEKGGVEDTFLNRAVADRDDGTQWKLAPGGFRGADLSPVRVEQRSTMRTAVARDGRARDGHLYTLGAIARGTVFLARVDADEDEDLHLIRALHGSIIRIGKARSAEFGGVRVEVLHQAPPAAALATEQGETTTVRLLALTDLVLRTPEGTPTFTPSPTHFGLSADWSWDAGRSFLRTRVWSPFNAVRRRSDLERQAIVAGSVLTFRGPSPVDLVMLGSALARGVGDGRAEGLGRVLVNPTLLASPQHKVEATKVPAPPPTFDIARITGHELMQWLDVQEKTRVQHDEAWAEAMGVADRFAQSNARLPRAQWGELRRLARTHAAADRATFVGHLKNHLVEDEDAARKQGRSTRKGERRWGQKVRIDGQPTQLGKWLVGALDEVLGRPREAPLNAAAVLELVAIHAPRRQAARAARVERQPQEGAVKP